MNKTISILKIVCLCAWLFTGIISAFKHLDTNSTLYWLMYIYIIWDCTKDILEDKTIGIKAWRNN